MKQNDPLPQLRKQIEMYFDQTLDPQSREAFLQKVDTDPVYQQAYQHELAIRTNLKKHVYRPANSSQLIQAIKNQIQKP